MYFLVAPSLTDGLRRFHCPPRVCSVTVEKQTEIQTSRCRPVGRLYGGPEATNTFSVFAPLSLQCESHLLTRSGYCAILGTICCLNFNL